MTASTKREGLEPGIYFGLPDDIYFGDMALSRSDILNILDSANTFWANSWMNPAREVKQKNDEMIFGTAFHTLLFEPKEFNNRFFVMPPDKWQTGKHLITSQQFDQLKKSIAVLRAGKHSNLFLRAGQPEVTIVFDDEGIRYRTKHDYLCIAHTTEFKTAASLEEWHLKNEFRRRGLDVQMTLYMRARMRFREQYNAGEAHVYGNVDKVWFRKFMDEALNDFIFIFQRKTAPYPFLPLMPEQDTYDSGDRKISIASNIYKKYMDMYGANVPWPVSEGKVRRFSMIYGIAEES